MLKFLKTHQYSFLLTIIFLIGIFLRFLNFPNDIHFSYDQARDAFSSLELAKGNIKLIGPPSSFNENLRHGPLVYYLWAPILLFGKMNPIFLSIFIRIINSLGIIIVFLITSRLFNKKTGLIASFIFAFSYEQTQYSLYISHPSYAVLSVLIYILGLTEAFFKNKSRGIYLAAIGLGISIQFHFVNIIQIILFFLAMLITRKNNKIPILVYIKGIIVFILAISPYIIAEVKNQFRSLKTIFAIVSDLQSNSGASSTFSYTGLIIRPVTDNITTYLPYFAFFAIFILTIYHIINHKQYQKELFFAIFIWIVGFIPYLLTKSTTYYFSIASSSGLIILVAFLISQFLDGKNRIMAVVILLLIGYSNISLIFANNYLGPNNNIVIQPGMLLGEEIKVLDYIYNESHGNPFSVSTISVPFNVNTTWDYLFSWYGQQKYHRLPIWTGRVADGYPSYIPVEKNRGNTPLKHYLIIESTVGIPQYMINEIIQEENYFTRIEKTRDFGSIKVEVRNRY